MALRGAEEKALKGILWKIRLNGLRAVIDGKSERNFFSMKSISDRKRRNGGEKKTRSKKFFIITGTSRESVKYLRSLLNLEIIIIFIVHD
jgi:hypothetical protein